MKANNILELYDSFWFERSIIRGTKHSSSPPTNTDQPKIKDEPSDLKSLTIPAKDFKSIIDNSLKHDESFSPNSVLPNYSSHPFSTKKDVAEDSNPIIIPKRKRSSRKIRKRKSVAELEMEEVEGFMDVGFVFTEEDRHSSLASIIPGLKRMWKEDEDYEFDDSEIQRPYLSETWDIFEWKKEVEKPLNWKIPEDMRNEVKMKVNMKLWAQTVASLVRDDEIK
ncbi:hypothetical protein K1719_041163 [Acacia pycnantha]|nr:hypothetical protein K1719_046923 [Acacia pycnantha]KAI9076859.1 hypothetical protein K1719_041163 [Acacia pycnantha]